MRRHRVRIGKRAKDKLATAAISRTESRSQATKDVIPILVVALMLSVPVWGITESLKDNVGHRCPSCPVGATVWMLNGEDYVLLPGQETIAGIVGIAFGALVPMRRRYADGPSICGVGTRYYRHYRMPVVSPIALIQRGWPTTTAKKVVVFVIMFLTLILTTTASFVAGAAHTTDTTYGRMKKFGSSGPLFSPALGACQGRHCVGCLSVRQWVLSRTLPTWAA